MLRKRVRLHLADPHPGADLPSVEGILVGYDRGLREYRIVDPELLVAAGAEPARLADARELRVPRDRVAFYEVIRG